MNYSEINRHKCIKWKFVIEIMLDSILPVQFMYLLFVSNEWTCVFSFNDVVVMGSKRKATRDLVEVNTNRTASDSEARPEGNGEEGMSMIDAFCFSF